MPDGTLKPAIRASGKCTVLCVLKAITEPDPLNPNRARSLMPSFSDPLYFGSGKDAGGK